MDFNCKKKIFYWSPFLVPIATPRAVINSAFSLQKFSGNFQCSIINFFREFDIFAEELIEKNIKLINYFSPNIIFFLPRFGKFQSRFSFFILFIMSFVPLKKILKKEEPDYLIIHLITSLPLFLLLLFNFKTKFILRISGTPKLNFFRKTLWNSISKKIHLVTCPTLITRDYIRNLNIFDKKKISVLYDPVIEIKKVSNKLNKNEKDYPQHKNFYLAAGRLTKQKNFLFLCRAFHKTLISYPNNKLLIAGDGEEKKNILNFIYKNSLQKNIILLSHVENIYFYMKKAKCFILSSLWEDPGFVLVEAAYSRVPVISSDCLSGPKEIINDKINGLLFESNNILSFQKKFDYFEKSNVEKKVWIYNNFKLVKNFTLFRHFNTLIKSLEKC